MIDIARDERAGRDAFMGDPLLPAPSTEVRAALLADGFILEEANDGYPAVHAMLPEGWRKEADPIDGRRFYLVDKGGERRFTIFWKAARIFSDEKDSGGISVVADDGIQRGWAGDRRTDDGKVYSVHCPDCCVRAAMRLDWYALDRRPASALSLVAEVEWNFARDHAATGCPRAKREPGTVFVLNEAGELKACEATGPTMRAVERTRREAFSALRDESKWTTLSKSTRRQRARRSTRGRRGARRVEGLFPLPVPAPRLRSFTAKPVVSSRGRHVLVYLPDPAGPAEVARVVSAMDREQEELEMARRQSWWVGA